MLTRTPQDRQAYAKVSLGDGPQADFQTGWNVDDWWSLMIEGDDDASSGPKRNGHHILVRLNQLRGWPSCTSKLDEMLMLIHSFKTDFDLSPNFPESSKGLSYHSRPEVILLPRPCPAGSLITAIVSTPPKECLLQGGSTKCYMPCQEWVFLTFYTILILLNRQNLFSLVE